MEKYIDDGRIHEGHRGRMRQKLLQHGQRIFDTYELLEMLLYHVIPYRDTNPIAKRLLAFFGSLDGVFSADKESLMEISGVGERAAEYLTLVGGLSDIIGAEILTDFGPDLSSYDAVGKYLLDYFRNVNEKQTVALFLDGSMQLINMCVMYTLDYESGGVKPRAFIDRAVEHSAAVVITAHNHPYGPFYPTQGDRASHKSVSDALAMAGIVHAEHYIISGENYAGMGSLGNFSARLSQMPALDRFLRSLERGESLALKSPIEEEKVCQTEKSGYNRADMGYLEQLLSYAGEGNAADNADKLIEKYRIIESIFTVHPRELTSLVGERTAIYIKLLAYAISRRRTDLTEFGCRYERAEIAEHLKALFLGESIEKTYLIAFDKGDRLLGIELLSEGTVSASEVLPRKAVEAALSLKASRVSIAHNHPFGSVRPSSDDITVTQHFELLFANCDIKLMDHFIVAGQLCDIVNAQNCSEL